MWCRPIAHHALWQPFVCSGLNNPLCWPSCRTRLIARDIEVEVFLKPSYQLYIYPALPTVRRWNEKTLATSPGFCWRRWWKVIFFLMISSSRLCVTVRIAPGANAIVEWIRWWVNIFLSYFCSMNSTRKSPLWFSLKQRQRILLRVCTAQCTDVFIFIYLWLYIYINMWMY